jgi:hypothetical protein
MAELRTGIEGRIDRWSARHGTEVGGGTAECMQVGGDAQLAHGGRRGCPLGGPGWLSRPGKKPGNNSFRIK